MNERYSRQILLGEIGEAGQQKLLNGTVAIVGCGGLGAIAASYLAGAGIGTIILIDGDSPSISNVHRQILYSGNEIESKAVVLNKKLHFINPEIRIETFKEYLTKENINSCLTGVDLILECTDDIMCKYLVNDFAVIEQIPLVYGAIYKYEGYVSIFLNKQKEDVHLRDIFPHPDESIPTCAEVGVLNTIAGIIGLMQANEALKFILKIGDSLVGKLLTYDCLTNRQMTIAINKSWMTDLEEYFEKQSYLPLDCSFVPDLKIERLLSDRNNYTLISVMPSAEHQSIDEGTIHCPLFAEDHNILNEGNKPIVIYCKYGKTSKQLAAKLIMSGCSRKIFNLDGGYHSYQKLRVSH